MMLSRQRISRSRLGLVTTLAVLLLAGLVSYSASGGVPQAQAEWFCNGYNAAPQGQPGDTCASGTLVWTGESVHGFGENHSMCVDAYDQYANLRGPWVCSGGPFAEAYQYYGAGWQANRGVARNNTTGDRNIIHACQSGAGGAGCF